MCFTSGPGRNTLGTASRIQSHTSANRSGLNLLLAHESLVLQDAETVKAALEQFQLKPALGFSDCLALEITRKAGHLPMGAFDKALANLAGTQKL